MVVIFPFSSFAIIPPEYNTARNPLLSEIELGFIYNNTNSEKISINSRLKFNYLAELGPDRHALLQLLSLRHNFTQDDDVITTQNFLGEYQANYQLSSGDYLFARAEINYDQFASYSEEETFSLGYSYKFYDLTKLKLYLEIGPGYRYSLPNNIDNTATVLQKADEPIIRTAVVWQQRFSKNLKLLGDISLEYGRDNSIGSANGRLENYLIGDLYLVIELRYKYTEVVPESTANKEIFSNLNLMYSF